MNVTVVAFTTYWKCWRCCIHCLFGVNEYQWLVYTHTLPFIPTWYYFMIPNTCITFLLTQCSIHEYKTGNNVCNSIVVFTTYWKFWCHCIHCLFGVNECQQLVNTFILPSNMILFSDSNDSTISITFPLTLYTIHEYKTGNNISEFMHSNWITLSYYSGLTHMSLIPKCFTHFCTQ